MVSLRAVLRDEVIYDFSLSEIEEKYQEWVQDDKYMILNRVHFKAFKIRDSRTNQYFSVRLPIKNEIYAVKCSKRGNDVYRFRVYSKFKGLASKAKKLVFFNPKDRGEKKTKALWVTLTYDPSRCSFKDAWRNIGIEFNRFMAYVRKHFGKVSCCRVFESYKSGHPHIHCILLFEETEFKVFRDRKGQFRIKEKDAIASGWHSFVDVKAMYSLGKSFSYLKKYLLKSIDAETKDSLVLKTLALCWLFCKRAFSVSGKFRQLLSDLIIYLHNSNRRSLQITLSGEIIQEEKFSVIGFVPADVIRLEKDTWFKKLDSDQVSLIDKFLTTSAY